MDEPNQEGIEEEPNEEPGSSTMQFEVSITTDRDHFLRRTCPACGLDFKTMVDQADFAWLLSEQIKRSGLDIGAMPEGEEEQVVRLVKSHDD